MMSGQTKLKAGRVFSARQQHGPHLPPASARSFAPRILVRAIDQAGRQARNVVIPAEYARKLTGLIGGVCATRRAPECDERSGPPVQPRIGVYIVQPNAIGTRPPRAPIE